eukprot:PITA_16413
MLNLTFACSANPSDTIFRRSECFADQVDGPKTSLKNRRKEVRRVNDMKRSLRICRRQRTVLCEVDRVQSQTVVNKEWMHESLAISEVPIKGVPVVVMLPLDTVKPNGTLNRKRALNASLMALKSGGVEDVMVDVWWGLVEKDGPGNYNWSGYKELVDMVSKHGLKLQAVMAFHQCGGNVGDTRNIPLPGWVLEEVERNPDLVYTDKAGRRNKEYISLGCDTLPLLKGRTPIQVYADYMRSFRDAFRDMLGKVIVEIQVGMGPCGELAYPSYPESNGTWRFPGIGEFQCYDKYMKASLRSCSEAVGKGDWGRDCPRDSRNYSQIPEDAGFFRGEGTWNTDYGRFFLNWYSEMLLAHGDRILSAAEGIFRASGAKLSGKVAGIHSHYNSNFQAAELTAGYYNTREQEPNGYVLISRLFIKRGAVLNFTCFEMKDEEGLLRQVTEATRKTGVGLAGENALQRFNGSAYAQIRHNSNLNLQGINDNKSQICAFTYLRMDQQMFESQNWHRFVWFVRNMSEGRTIGHVECVAEVRWKCIGPNHTQFKSQSAY